MKTKEIIEKEISHLILEAKELNDEDKKKKQLRKNISLLRTCIRFLETNPKEEFVMSMKLEAERRIKVYNRRVEDWKAGIPSDVLSKIKNPAKNYYKEVAPAEVKELKNARAQLKTLSYILG